MTNRGFSAEIEQLAAEINSAFVERRAPHFDRGNIAAWVEAVNLQMLIGQIEVAEHGLRHLRARFPTVTYANRVGDIFNRLPLAGEALPFKDDPESDIQIVTRDHSRTVLLLFCGREHNMGLPLSVVHRWTGRLSASLIYLRDFRRRHFLDGLTSLGATQAATVAALRGITASLGARRVVCWGSSAGVFGALHYGLGLEADAILCLGGIVNMTPEFNAYSVYERSAIKLQAELPDTVLDVRPLYQAAACPPRVRMICGAEYWNDRIHAEYMAMLSCVTLQVVENFGEHNVIVELIRRGQFEAALHWLVSDDRHISTS